MKTKNAFWPLCAVASLMLTINVQAQTSVLGHTGLSGDYLGWNSGTTIPLEIRHDGNESIEWYTDALHRMGLYPNVNNVVNGYTINQTGYLGLSDQPAFFNGSGPFTKIHLVEAMGSTNPVNYAQELGYRDWMRNGITMTGNSDQSYMGAKYNGDDISDLVLQWSDNPEDAIYGTDRLRFLFTNRPDSGALYGARSEEGLESFRVFVPNDTSANVGIGDFYRESVLTSSVVDPTERLDILDGRVRIRQLPQELEMDSVDKYVVVNEDGVLGWRPTPTGTGTGGGACDWSLITSGPNVRNVYTAFGTGTTCPSEINLVGIGTASPGAKLHVLRKQTSGDEVGLWVQTYTDGNFSGSGAVAYGVRSSVINATGESATPVHTGVQGVASNATSNNTGVHGSASNISNMPNSVGCFGVKGDASGTGVNSGVMGYAVLGTTMYGTRGWVSTNTGATSYGAHGLISGPAGATGLTSYGVYGQVLGGDTTNFKYSVYGTNPGAGSNNWAGYFAGRTYTPGGLWTASDEGLKSNIEDIQSASERLLQLNPKSYVFNSDQYPSMGLPLEKQYGFLAQELEIVFPEMVKQTTHPAMLDSLGNEEVPAIPFKAVNLSGLTPYLVAAFQEQHQQLAETQATNAALNDQLQQLNDRLDAMEQSVSNCCAAQGALQNGGEEIDEKTLNSNDRYLRIAPNPFETQTTISYQLDQGGRMQLVANSADGKQLQVLQEANLEQGNYQYEWNTGDLAPGVYYVTLLVDAKPITKRAVKILR